MRFLKIYLNTCLTSTAHLTKWGEKKKDQLFELKELAKRREKKSFAYANMIKNQLIMSISGFPPSLLLSYILPFLLPLSLFLSSCHLFSLSLTFTLAHWLTQSFNWSLRSSRTWRKERKSQKLKKGEKER